MGCTFRYLVSKANPEWFSAFGVCLALLFVSSVRAESPAVSTSVDKVSKPEATTSEAIFAGGCFWCMQKPYDELPGVVKTEVGYTGGHVDKPTYEQVSAGDTGHREAIRITFNPDEVTYSKLLDIFWHNVDPFDRAGQFCDKGMQYTSAIYYLDQKQKEAAEASKSIGTGQSKIKGEIATEVVPAKTFYLAEEYHQSYYLKNPYRYKFYRYSCGRDKRLEAVWGPK